MATKLSSHPRNLFITGGTGFVGKAVLARLLREPWVGDIYLLVRSTSQSTASARLQDQLIRMFGEPNATELSQRVFAIAGDLTLDGLGIHQKDIATLNLKCHQILHCGATTDFGASLSEARRTNLDGTRNILTVANTLWRDGILHRLDYVSTAYVAGTSRGIITEADLENGQSFFTAYEQSKFEAERLIRENERDFPITIYRPSIVVGHSYNGYTPQFKVPYLPLMILAQNLTDWLVCNPNAHLDIVPVDFVADSIVALFGDSQAAGHTFMLSAGLGREIKIRQLIDDAITLGQVTRRPLMPTWIFDLIRTTPLSRFFSDRLWTVAELTRPYQGYIRGVKARFDPSATHAYLDRFGIKPPHWSDYKKEIIQYCLASRWGKRPPRPEHDYYQLPSSSMS